MGIEIAAGATARLALPTAAKPTADAKPATPSSSASAADTVVLSPQAQALKTLLSATDTAAPAEKTEAEQKAEEVFMEAVKTFFVETMGLDKNKTGKVRLNKEALHYILRNTVLGALAPPSLLKEQGIDFASRPPQRNGPLAEITIEGKEKVTVDGDKVKREKEPALARVMFDPAAMEELARVPKKAKDRDRDGFFTPLDLMPATRELKTGKPIDNGPRFEEADKRFAKEDDSAPIQLGLGVRRVTLTDGQNRPFFMARLRGDVEKPLEATAHMCFGLLQFARGATL
ncbi:hypothetical protein [Azospirillum sp. TSO22-1]|uniref:hypothetical protein n=1 Tax=Azospirillum sp. TSO22-1 TaxID=716789 RepID=UPI000D61EA53|nr:hypothetical protein [Azospirillum sp. TSO22-1]PWC52301.1 hypothetical protein TSO221_14645 [Azospirillum sp. TSO22-1]